MPITPLQIADDLVPRFLAGEAMKASEIAEEFRVDRESARQAVRYARDVLRDEHNVVLPIAHFQNPRDSETDWLLAITTSAIDAFLGEVPQLRMLRTRERNLSKRLHAAFALAKTRPRLAQNLMTGLDIAFLNVNHSVDTVIAYMTDEIEAGK